ncbi:hypothetical protein KEF85_06115 [Methylomonas paludis]|uniref:Uncharacterized protein n=1 Tax=Methylomonas paludis TaxID=1173101 RepID=A0A975MQP0_9GAMM|nr:hypothetical protein [Methylomonas paludis]QWF72030.1 hypothetical protein KEF85_06115 [Methylomonas paludis]
MEQSCLFGPSFLEKFVGKHILYDPKVAILELIANAWDAGATQNGWYQFPFRIVQG